MFFNCFVLQVYHTFASTGSDGVVNFWDKDSKQRLKVHQNEFVDPRKIDLNHRNSERFC